MAMLRKRPGGWDRVLIGTALMMALAASALSAQRSGRGYFQAGVHELDLDELNQRLALFGVEAFDERFMTLGGGGHLEIGRIMLGGEGHGLIPQKQTSGGFERELSGGMGFFNAGVILLREASARAYLLVGLGAGGYELETTERSLPTFDDVMVDPTRGSELSIGGFLVQAAVGLDYVARVTRGAGRGISIGVRGGYTYAPSIGEWAVNGSDAPGGPEVGITGPYVRLSVGGGGGR